MSEQQEFIQQMILAQEAVNSINRNSYLKNIESSINDIRLRAKLEDDPLKQNILIDELNSLLAEKNEYLLGLKYPQKRRRRVFLIILIVFLVLPFLKAITAWHF